MSHSYKPLGFSVLFTQFLYEFIIRQKQTGGYLKLQFIFQLEYAHRIQSSRARSKPRRLRHALVQIWLGFGPDVIQLRARGFLDASPRYISRTFIVTLLIYMSLARYIRYLESGLTFFQDLKDLLWVQIRRWYFMYFGHFLADATSTSSPSRGSFYFKPKQTFKITRNRKVASNSFLF